MPQTQPYRSFAIAAMLAIGLSTGLRGQFVSATAVVGNAVATANSVSSFLPTGTAIVNGTSVIASSGTGTTARTSFGLTVVDNAVDYTVAQPLQAIGPAVLSTNSETVLSITSTQTLDGRLSVLVTATLFAGTFAIDIGNDGTIDLTGNGQQSVTVDGSLEVRVIANHAMFVPSGSLLQTASVQLVFEPFASCTVRNGSGVNPNVCACASLPIIGQPWQLDVAAAPSTVAELAFGSLLPMPPVALPFGELLIEPVGSLQLPGTGSHVVAVPNQPGLIGLPVYVQAVRLNTTGTGLAVELTNALEGVIGS